MPNEENDPMKMNAEFVLMYILYNSDTALRIELMNLVRNMMPLPMYFKKFDNIMSISDDVPFLNEELIWTMK